MKHKVLIIGKSNKNSLEDIYKQNFNYLGIDCQIFDLISKRNFIINFFDHQKIFPYFENYNIRKKISEKLQSEILEFINHFKPTIVFFFNLNFVFPETVNSIKKKNILTLEFLSDNFFDINDFSRVEIKKTLDLIDYHFFWGQNHLKINYKNSYLLDFAWNSLVKLKFYKKIQKKISFVGFLDNSRIKLLNKINNNSPLHVVGKQSLNSIFKKKNFTYQNIQLDFESYLKISKISLVNLNILRQQNIIANGTNQRTFELPGEECFMLQNWTDRSEKIFSKLSEEVLFKNLENLNYLLEKMLSNEKKIFKIKKEMHILIKENHTYLHRVKSILKII